MGARKRKRSQQPFQQMSQPVKVTLLVMALLSCFLIASELNFSHYFPIKKVRVYGANRVDHQEVKGLMLPLVNRGFFTIKVDYIRDRLLQLPWVADVFVRRGWPDRVDITVVEKNAVAYWGRKGLLSDSGQVFTPREETYPQHLPQFKGPDGQQIAMMEYFNEMNRLLTALHAKISYLEMTPYATLRLMLDSGIKLELGRQDALRQLANFVRVYPKIVGGKAADVESVDLRYANGVAVRWKTPDRA